MSALPQHRPHPMIPGRHRSLRSPVKRLIDLLVAGAALSLLSPLLLALAILIRATSPGPALFRQERVGAGGRPFMIFKLRTMVAENDDRAHREANIRELRGEGPTSSDGIYKLESDPRVTRVGAWLRRLSLDELPQLINVIRGEMSIVGPRPALQWEVDHYPSRYLRRLSVRPGITGLWQVSGRNRLSMLEMLDLDCRYVDEWSIGLDISIMAKTPGVLLRGDGAR